MKLKYTTALLAALALPHFAFAEEEDTPVKFSDIPAAVAKAIRKAAGDAKLDKVVRGDEDGTLAYEAVWEAGGHKHEIAVAKDGTVLTLEEIITLDEVPEAVRAAVVKEAAGAKVVEVEKVLEKGKTSYEATIEKGGSKRVVSVSVKGKILEREETEKGEKDEKDEKEEKSGKKEKKD